MSKNQNMIMVASTYQGAPSFKLIPTSLECPYVEAIFNPIIGALALIGKEKRDIFTLVEKLDANGSPLRAKGASGTQQERKSVTTNWEYYITTKKEVIAFLEQFTTNSDQFDIDDLYKIADARMVPDTTSMTDVIVTQEMLDENPELVEAGAKVGETVQIPTNPDTN